MRGGMGSGGGDAGVCGAGVNGGCTLRLSHEGDGSMKEDRADGAKLPVSRNEAGDAVKLTGLTSSVGNCDVRGRSIGVGA